MEIISLFIRHNSGACALDKSLLATAVAIAIVAAALTAGYALSALYNLLYPLA